MTNIEQMMRGASNAVAGLQDVLDAEADDCVHFLSQSDYSKISETLDLIEVIHDRLQARVRKG